MTQSFERPHDIRQSHLYYIEPAIYVVATLILLLLTSWFVGIFFYFFLILSIFAAGLTFRKFSMTYKQHKDPQLVLTVKGKLTYFTFTNIETMLSGKPEPCLGPNYYLHVPNHMLLVSGKKFEECINVDTYCADITAHKSSGYTLLSSDDVPPLTKLVINNPPTTLCRGLLFFIITIPALILTLNNTNFEKSISNISEIISDLAVTETTYTSTNQLFENPPKKGDSIQIISSAPIACGLDSQIGSHPPSCKSFYINPPSSAMKAPELPDYIYQMIDKRYLHTTQSIRDSSWIRRDDSWLPIYIVTENILIHDPAFIDNIEEACQFDVAFDCGVIYKRLADLLIRSDNLNNYFDDKAISDNADDYKDEVVKILKKNDLKLAESSHDTLQNLISKWASSSLEHYLAEYYIEAEREYMASDTPKVRLIVESFDTFKAGSIQSELSQLATDHGYDHLATWLDTISIRNRQPEEFILSGRLLKRIKSKDLMILSIVTDSTYKEANKYRKQSIIPLLTLFFLILVVIISFWLCVYKPKSRRKLL